MVHVDSQEQAAQGAGPTAPVGGQEFVRVRGWARGGFGVRSESVRGTAADKVHAGVLRFATASVIIKVSEPAGRRPDPPGRGRSADPGLGAWVGRPGLRGGGCRPFEHTGTCGPRRQPVFREGFGARRVCRAEPRAAVSVPGCGASCMSWTRIPVGLEARGPQALLLLLLAPPSSSRQTRRSCCLGGVG